MDVDVEEEGTCTTNRAVYWSLVIGIAWEIVSHPCPRAGRSRGVLF